MKKSKLVSLLEWCTIICAIGLIFTVLLQIVSRKLFVNIAPPWTEEISRFFFIYTISFGAGLAQKEGYFVSMDYFY
ncbi:MAG: TRAP transporter small permease, partial [Bacteroidetes bacterium]|nr:TRAP transporter small permease [Bacteroidota bacterium]